MAVTDLTDLTVITETPASPASSSSASRTVSSDWRTAVPVLQGNGLTLREVQPSDAAALFTLISEPDVARFISPPPPSIDGFERFASWARSEREAGRYICFAVVPEGSDTAVGLFQLRALDSSFETAEWGFVLGAPFWGTGLFMAGARLVLDFAVDVVGTHRIEARAAVANRRGNGALQKIGAIREGVLRRSFARHGRHFDQAIWSIIADEWRWQRAESPGQVH